MFDKITTAVSEALRTKTAALPPTPFSPVDDGNAARTESRLYECPSCDTVYVATSPHTCVTCQATVKPTDGS